jgi:hypothetical protein
MLYLCNARERSFAAFQNWILVPIGVPLWGLGGCNLNIFIDLLHQALQYIARPYFCK